MSCSECFQGVIHEGRPAGTIEQINGVYTYVALPDGEYARNKAVLFLVDAFGIGLVNNQLLADAFAKNGFATYIPDYLDGDGVPDNVMSMPDFDWPSWKARHTPAHTRPLLDKVISGLRAQGVTILGATGYCFGGRAAVDLALERVVKAVSMAHPSLLIWPDDFARLAAAGADGVPVQIHSCEFDAAFPAEACAAADAALGDGKHAPGYERVHWLGCTHSFAVRGDLTQPLVKAGKEGAFKGAVVWFQKYL